MLYAGNQLVAHDRRSSTIPAFELLQVSFLRRLEGA